MVAASIKLFALDMFLSAVISQCCSRRICPFLNCITFLIEMLQVLYFSFPPPNTSRKEDALSEKEVEEEYFIGLLTYSCAPPQS